MGTLADFRKVTPTPYLKVPDGSSRTVSFLAEVKDFDWFVEHVSPVDWRKNALCTYDTGMCYACEQQSRTWNQRVKVFIPVLYRNNLRILSQGSGANSLVHSLLDHMRQNDGTILDSKFKITREGTGKRTKYRAVAVDKTTPEQYNGRVSLSHNIKQIAYPAQANYYTT